MTEILKGVNDLKIINKVCIPRRLLLQFFQQIPDLMQLTVLLTDFQRNQVTFQ